ncbi:MAG TPA: PhzF family phenazine biosynthesis protein [Longimicrobium sp.]|nr:PhzF family phenazine biosynthesis protein [Longimicrobium sp.]
MPHRFIIADVFTEQAFGGNQLAVLPDARGLSDTAMQTLAREFNFSESTFVLPPDDPAHAFRVRIFTPGYEMPFAGHPTVGTAAALAHLGLIPRTGRVVFEEVVGPVAVDVDVSDTRAFARLNLDARVQYPAGPPSARSAAAVLSLPEGAVREAWFASVGVPFTFIHLADREAVDAAVLEMAAWRTDFAASAGPSLFLFAGDLAAGSHLYARMFAPDMGIPEDPATGAASVTLAGSLADRLPEAEGTFTWHIDQGVKMGRPSRIEAGAAKKDGQTVRVMAGGSSVIVAEGTITVPDGV